MKKFILAGACVLALAGCDAIKGAVAPKEETPAPAAATLDPTVAALEAFDADVKIFPAADLGDSLNVPAGASATITEQGSMLLVTPVIAEPVSGGRPSGINIGISPELEQQFSNSRLTIKILARSGNESTVPMRVAYSTNEVGNSGWHDFDVGPNYSVYSYEYRVAPLSLGRGDFIGLLTEGMPIEIASIGIDSKKLAPSESEEVTDTEAAVSSETASE